MKTALPQKRALRYSLLGASFALIYAAGAFVIERLAGLRAAEAFLLSAPVLIVILLYALGREEDMVRKRADDLDEARLRFASLTHSAITEPDWQVPFHDSSIPTCWEIKECSPSSCPVHGKHHVRCWLVAGTYCRGEVQGTFAQKLGDCSKCEVYLESIKRGPIYEIAEHFNSLIWAVREKEEMLTTANQELTRKFNELGDLQKKTREIADRDALTGLKNYGHFRNKIKTELARAKRYGRSLSLIMLDMDNFKHINDRFGHQKGDIVLKKVGELLENEIRSSDYAARYSGERFVIIMPETWSGDALKFAERLNQKMKRVSRGADVPDRYVGVSVGISDFPDCASDVDSLLSAADSALLFARRKGKRSVSYFCDLSETELSEGDLERLYSRLESAGLYTIRALAEAVDAADHYHDRQRIELVSIAGEMAERLGLGEEQTDSLALAVCLHDIGKIGVPNPLLQKSGTLSTEEMELVRRHPEIGAQLLAKGKHLENLVSAIHYHHENWDGSGYPEGLKGEEIPMLARIVGILDTFRALRSDRPYRQALTMTQVINELKKGSGKQYDPALVSLLLETWQSREQETMRRAG